MKLDDVRISFVRIRNFSLKIGLLESDMRAKYIINKVNEHKHHYARSEIFRLFLQT